MRTASIVGMRATSYRFTSVIVLALQACIPACSPSPGVSGSDASDRDSGRTNDTATSQPDALVSLDAFGTSDVMSTDTGMTSSCASILPGYTTGNGSVTFYTFDQGSSAVNCGFDITGRNPDSVAHVSTGNGQFFGAMNTTDYNTAATCGACVEVTRDGTRSVVVTIVDQCPSGSNPVCTAGHIDLSKNAFLQLGTATEGYLGTGNHGARGVISWRYVACPTTENVTFRLKEAANMYWNQILVEAHRYPIASVEVQVAGVWRPATRMSYNYWQVGSGNIGLPPYTVRATDIYGSQVQATLTLRAGDQTSTSQFPMCQ